MEMLQDLITAAVNEAGRKIDNAMQSTVGGHAGWDGDSRTQKNRMMEITKFINWESVNLAIRIGPAGLHWIWIAREYRITQLPNFKAPDYHLYV